MKRFLVLLIFSIVFSSYGYCKTQKEEYQNDILYSEEYFDYLIEIAQNKSLDESKNDKNADEIVLDDNEIDVLNSNDTIVVEYEPFKLRIQQNNNVSPYGESFKKVDSKTIIPISDNFSIIQNMTKSRNKYNSNDYRVLAGGEYIFNKNFYIASGLETNYRGIDQNPTSRKLYFSPNLKIGNKFSVTFHNKLNIQSYSTDHDVGINLSPFKSKKLDFGVYAGVTRKQNGSCSESVNFSTTFFF